MGIIHMTNKVKYVGQIKGFLLIKIKSKRIIEETRRGSFYMNSLKVFREMYKNSKDNVIGDPYEGKLIIYDAIIQIPELGINEVVKDSAFSTANENDFVFCMFGVNPNKHCSFQFTGEQKQKLINFDDTALLIIDVYEFCKRIKNAAIARNLVVKSGFVDYYDETVDDVGRLLKLVVNGMENIVFHKIKDYSYQQEYRFTIQNSTGAACLELNIGDISSISEVFTTTEMLNSHMEHMTV